MLSLSFPTTTSHPRPLSVPTAAPHAKRIRICLADSLNAIRQMVGWGCRAIDRCNDLFLTIATNGHWIINYGQSMER